MKTAAGNCPYVGVPAFVSRAFRHTSIYVRTDRIKEPEDLKGKKVGVPEYQLTANVWARAILEDDYGVKPSDIHWIRGGIEEAGRPEKITIKLPDGVRLDNAPEGTTISRPARKGEIDGFIAPRPPAFVERGHPNIGWLFRDPMAVAKDYYKRTGIFPIMHLIGVRRTLAEKHPWLPAAVLKAFEQSKAAALTQLSRHLGHQGDAALRRGAAEGSARPDGRAISGPTGSSRTARRWRPSCATITRRDCRRGLSRSTSCFTPARTRASSCRPGGKFSVVIPGRRRSLRTRNPTSNSEVPSAIPGPALRAVPE